MSTSKKLITIGSVVLATVKYLTGAETVSCLEDTKAVWSLKRCVLVAAKLMVTLKINKRCIYFFTM